MITERLLLTLWVGSLWAIGFIAVPMAFATLGDVNLAGNYAAKLFSVVNIIGLASGVVLVLSKLFSHGKQVKSQWRFWLIVLMLVQTLFLHFYVQVEIESLKLLGQQSSEAFDRVHHIGSNVYLFLSVLGIVLVLSSDKVINNGQK
ncbi:MAG: hypothetical protein COA90_10110 [Gammaproteobacteria bacterium]|nr:MAG: hypothetical protein COA90_10110 [Gammaproteobacteria bacterium]